MSKKNNAKVTALSCECGTDSKCRTRFLSEFGNTMINVKDEERIVAFKDLCNAYNKFITGTSHD